MVKDIIIMDNETYDKILFQDVDEELVNIINKMLVNWKETKGD